MKLLIILATALALNAHAQQAPKPSPAQVAAPRTNAPTAALGQSQTIKLANGVTITVASPKPFTNAELRRWLREAMMQR